MNVLQRLMFWRKPEEPQAEAPLPDSRPNDPLTTESRPEAPDEKEYREERQRPRGGESAFRAKLFEEHEPKADEGEPPDDTH
jgi:hypothetical protein